MIYDYFDSRCRNVIDGTVPIDRNKLNEDEKRNLYHALRLAETAIVEEFHQALALNYGLSGHPREAKAWSKAWEEGHSDGLCMVELHYEEIADILVGPIS